MFNWLMLIIMFYILYDIQLPLFSIKKNIVRISFFFKWNGILFLWFFECPAFAWKHSNQLFCILLSLLPKIWLIVTSKMKKIGKIQYITIFIYFHGNFFPKNLSLLSTPAPSSFCWLLQLLRPIHLLNKELSWICPTALLVKKVSICKSFISFS